MPKIKTPNLTEAIVKETKAYMAANPAATPAELDVHLAAFTAKMGENVTDIDENQGNVEKTSWFKSPTAINTYKVFGGIAALALAGFGGYRYGRSTERKANSNDLPMPAPAQAQVEVAPAATVTPMKALKVA